MKIVVKAECAAPPEVVFGVMMDVPNWPRFIGGIKKIEVLTSGPIAVGMRFRATRLNDKRRIGGELKLAVIDAPWRIAFTAVEGSRRQIFTTDIVPDGIDSRLTVNCEIIPVTFAARLCNLFAFLPPRGLRKQMASDIAGVVREAERRIGK